MRLENFPKLNTNRKLVLTCLVTRHKQRTLINTCEKWGFYASNYKKVTCKTVLLLYQRSFQQRKHRFLQQLRKQFLQTIFLSQKPLYIHRGFGTVNIVHLKMNCILVGYDFTPILVIFSPVSFLVSHNPLDTVSF